MELQAGDSVRLKKQHPCGANRWKLLRVGMDVRMECTGCGHQLRLSRKQAERLIREIMPEEKTRH